LKSSGIAHYLALCKAGGKELVGFEEGSAAENLRAKRHEIIGDEGGRGGVGWAYETACFECQFDEAGVAEGEE
jgi:hypothetical protein